MRIVILSAFYDPFMSGAEQMVKELAERLGDKNEIVIITARLQSALPSSSHYANFVVERVGMGHKKIDKFLFPFLAAWRVRRHHPAIVHAIMESYAGAALILIKYFYPSAKRVLTLQSGDLDDGRYLRRWWFRLVWPLIHLAPDHITAISTFLADRAGRLGVASDKISIIPNGVDLNLIPKGLSAKFGQVVCVARLSWEKGLEDLLRAWKAVIKEESQARLKIVGDGPERAKLIQLAHDLEVASSVTFAGRLPHGEVLKAMSEAEIFVCPSLAEGLGIVFIEAQACGVPVIGTRVGGIPDVIHHEQTGLLVSPHDPVSLSEAIVRLLQDRHLAGRLSRAALLSVRQYEWTKIVEQIKVVYRRLCPEF